MTQTELLDQITRLSPKERLDLVEAAIRLIRNDLRSLEPRYDAKLRLTNAAGVLLQDYETDKDLTGFTALDGEAFHAPG